MKSSVPAPAVLTLLLPQKTNRMFPTSLVGQAQAVPSQVCLKTLGMEKFRENPAKAIQSISGKIIPYTTALKGISLGLSTSHYQM